MNHIFLLLCDFLLGPANRGKLREIAGWRKGQILLSFYLSLVPISILILAAVVDSAVAVISSW